MPHLSPMSWLLAISMFWFFLWMLSSKSWWSKLTLMPFTIKSHLNSIHKSSQWKWN